MGPARLVFLSDDPEDPFFGDVAVLPFWRIPVGLRQNREWFISVSGHLKREAARRTHHMM